MRSMLKRLLCWLAILPAFYSAGQADAEFAELSRQTQSKIDQALAEYREFLNETQPEKLRLVSQINELEIEIVELRHKNALATQSSEEGSFQLEDLNERIHIMETQAQYSRGVLSEYLSNFESRIHVSEDQSYLAPLLEIREELANLPDQAEQRLPTLFRALELGLERQEALIGGKRFRGRAITPSGGVKDGTLSVIGPLGFFAADDGSAAGQLQFNSGTIEPGVAALSPLENEALSNLLSQGSGSLPLDSSLGSALELKVAKGTINEHISKGGWVGYAIIFLGFAALLVALYKFIDLRKVKVDQPADIRSIAIAAANESEETAQQKLDGIKGPVRNMLSIGIEFSRTDADTLFDAMESVILRCRPRLERFLPILATTAAVAPLMGLLGTVVGMIKTFTLIEVFGTGDAKSLSSGISEALVTTELGLIVAIPALIFHGVFTRIMRSRIGAMERIATDFNRYLYSKSR